MHKKSAEEVQAAWLCDKAEEPSRGKKLTPCEQIKCEVHFLENKEL